MPEKVIRPTHRAPDRRSRAFQRTIILASASPRRKDILRTTGIPFTTEESNCTEEIHSGLTPRGLARSLSRQKAQAVAARHGNAIVIAADTFIVFRGALFGKPHTETEAMRMLTSLSGKTHTVITGLTVIDTKSGRRVSRSAVTQVTFRRISKREREEYVRSGEPLDKAGGYAIQGLGGNFVQKIVGDYFNVVGLPLTMLIRVLKGFGVSRLKNQRILPPQDFFLNFDYKN